MKNIKYFKPIPRTLEELKKAYKKLAFEFHPDATKRDTNAEMAEINQEYEYIFEMVKNVKFNHKEQKFYESKEDTTETVKDFQNIINNLIKIKDIKIMICGSWLWVSGTTYPVRAELKNLGFGYSKLKAAWYLHYEPFKKKSKRVLNLEEIINLYGAQYFKQENNQFLLN